MKTLLFVLLSLASLNAIAESNPAVRPQDGGLPKDAIDNAIRAHLPAIQKCYRDELERKKNLGEDKVRTKFVVGAEGKVTSASAVSSIGNHRIEKCVEAELRALEFARPVGGGTVEVAYPFSFSPAPAKK